MERGDLAGVDGEELDAAEGEPVMEIGDVGELATEPIERFDYDQIEELVVGVGEQLLILRAIAAGAADRPVGVQVRTAVQPFFAM